MLWKYPPETGASINAMAKVANVLLTAVGPPEVVVAFVVG
jgi:hypothetical protein